MRVLLVSKFLHHVGGVETYLRWEANALAADGHQVAVFGMRPPSDKPEMSFSGDVDRFYCRFRSFHGSFTERAIGAASSIYNVAVARELRAAVDRFKPDVVHFHCTCYQLTPSIFDVAKRANLPAVMTAHEYKLACANQILFDERSGHICTDCVGKGPLVKSRSMIARNCVKGSRAATLVGALEMPLAVSRWKSTGGTVIAPSAFMQDILVRDGYSRVRYLDLPWDAVSQPRAAPGNNVLFLGRLEGHKGIFTLLRAWESLHDRVPESTRLRIAGSGFAEPSARDFVLRRKLPRVDFAGYLESERVADELESAAMTVHPAEWFENSPYSVRESLTHGVPALVSSIGGAPELVSERTGRVVPPGRPELWAEAILGELTERRAGSVELLTAVEERRTSEGDHLAGLLDILSAGAV